MLCHGFSVKFGRDCDAPLSRTGEVGPAAPGHNARASTESGEG